VKERKQHEERFFKDIVLRSILDDISNEQGKPLQDLISSDHKKNTKKQIAWLAVFPALIIVLAIFTMQVTEPVQKPILSTQDIALQTNKKEAESTTNTPEKKLSELKIQAKDDSLLIVSQNSAKSSTEPIQLSEHEIAKAQLLEQMKN
jgi:hypothetical protein